jgi:hypothetical protein
MGAESGPAEELRQGAAVRASGARDGAMATRSTGTCEEGGGALAGTVGGEGEAEARGHRPVFNREGAERERYAGANARLGGVGWAAASHAWPAAGRAGRFSGCHQPSSLEKLDLSFSTRPS